VGLEMTIEQERAFNDWWNKYYKSSSDIQIKEAAKEAWIAAVEYSENKSDRNFRWDGIIK
jgi:hypothetical protein